jgi:hypothetical protein
MQYSVNGQDHMPGINNFKSCNLTELPNNEWQVEGEVYFPPSARPDLYYVPAIFVSQLGVGDRSAMPLVPNFIKLENISATAVPTVGSLKVSNLTPNTKLGVFRDLTNSYVATPGAVFTVEFDVTGDVSLDDLWFDIEIWHPGPAEFLIAPGSGSSSSLPAVFINTEIKRVGNQNTVVMTFRMPANISGFQVAALKFKRFYIRSSDFSWVEIEMPGIHEAMIVNPQFIF